MGEGRGESVVCTEKYEGVNNSYIEQLSRIIVNSTPATTFHKVIYKCNAISIS